ncbi:MAG: glycoside hydrolase family 127 protein [Tannerellaceae bacterium]|jgi:DUF1680 family protein|nr:glycoside hydrolase family 127 protein [Tannerellaceae bacterium]
MKKYTLFILTPLIFASCRQADKNLDDTSISAVPFTQIQLTDDFWTSRIETNRTTSIPSAFHQCEINGRFDNFAIAAGIIKGEHKGDFPFDDTDPYKIIEGASYSLAVNYDAKLDAYLDSIIGLIASAQEPDGYLTTCVTNKCERLKGWWGSGRWEKINSHELYNSGHLYEAAVAHYQSTGKRTLLDVAIKNADLVCNVFGPGEGQKHTPSGHPIIEMALVKLYEVTGDDKYLSEARYFVEETGRGTDGHKLSQYSQDHMPILEQDEIVGHAVRAGYLYSGVVDVASHLHHAQYMQAATRIWDNMASKKLYITGGIGSRGDGEGFGPNYELHNHTGYCETCASIANVYWNQRMFLATGDARYADVLERALYNGVMSGVSLGGDRFFYDNVLASEGRESRQAWFGCACCPGNITRFVASVPKYMYATQGRNLFVNLYIASRSNIDINGTKLELTQTTNYPWDGNISLTLRPETPATFTLKLRLPSWAGDSPVPGSDLYSFATKPKDAYTVTVNNRPITATVKDGYLTINRKWIDGDVIQLTLPMEARYVTANEHVATNRGFNAIQRGPVVYCMEGVDTDDRHVFNKYIPTNTPLAATFEAETLNGIVELSATAGEVSRTADGGITERNTSVKLIPYSTWNNRGNAEMEVWIPASAEKARPQPDTSLLIARTSVSIVTDTEKDRKYPVYGATDQWSVDSSADNAKPYLSLWRQTQPYTIEYCFPEAEEVRRLQVYWMEFEHYDGGYRLPRSWHVQYKAGNTWKDVDASHGYEILKDAFSTADFSPVKTTALRLIVELQDGFSGGIAESNVLN